MEVVEVNVLEMIFYSRRESVHIWLCWSHGIATKFYPHGFHSNYQFPGSLHNVLGDN